ncbi:MAG: hypothetical protein JWO05_1458 [Gemmatimonadetes bacterium]|nr:hypothetical protein [Gemmatimonadota bacterium]
MTVTPLLLVVAQLAVTATRTSRPPSIDGRLDDAAWSTAPVVSGFVQSNPREGEPASERTEVRILYDDAALYVAARMFERDPARMRSVLTRRDDSGAPNDLFTIALDTYHDHQTAMQFSVNPAGVRFDQLSAGDQSSGDEGWDPVWEAATRADSGGWTAELRIPLSQLRFAQVDVQQWGINLFRTLSTRNELDALVLVRQNEQGFASRFATLDGIRGVPAPRRLELLPYARSQMETRRATPGDPFFDGSQVGRGAGLDLKYGLTSNLTLDATVNPDFGQVEADPAQLNLSAFESFFEERRPFFVEGSQIFSFGQGPLNAGEIFYSRRVGRAPTLSPNLSGVYAGSPDDVVGPFMDVPKASTILGAAKVSGKLAGGTSVGLLHAETGLTNGRVEAEQLFGPRTVNGVTTYDQRAEVAYRDVLEPRSHYSLARLRQDFRGGQTSIGLIATSVVRDLNSNRLDSLFRRDAQVAGLDLQHRWNHNRFNLGATLAGSRIAGSTTAISAAQRSSARYFQRPDQDYAVFDPTRTSLTGYTANARLRYDGPRGYGFGVTANSTTPGYELNDAGFIGQADFRRLVLSTSWFRPKPTKYLRRLGGELVWQGSWNFGNERTGRTAAFNTVAQFQNGWGTSLNLARGSRIVSASATRGGPPIISTPNVNANFNLYSDSRKRLSGSFFSYGFRTQFGTHVWGGGGSLTWRPVSNASFSVSPSYDDTHDRGYLVTKVPDALATGTFGVRYIAGALDQKTIDVGTRAAFTFTPKLSFQLYAEPFTSGAQVEGKDLREIRFPKQVNFTYYASDPDVRLTRDAAGNYGVTILKDGQAIRNFTIANPDASFRSLHGSAVLRWEYRPGSTMFAVWTHNRGRFDTGYTYGGIDDLRALFADAPENVFLLKVNYWLSR